MKSNIMLFSIFQILLQKIVCVKLIINNLLQDFEILNFS